jgi:hypothetical protein
MGRTNRTWRILSLILLIIAVCSITFALLGSRPNSNLVELKAGSTSNPNTGIVVLANHSPRPIFFASSTRLPNYTLRLSTTAGQTNLQPRDFTGTATPLAANSACTQQVTVPLDALLWQATVQVDVPTGPFANSARLVGSASTRHLPWSVKGFIFRMAQTERIELRSNLVTNEGVISSDRIP